MLGKIDITLGHGKGKALITVGGRGQEGRSAYFSMGIAAYDGEKANGGAVIVSQWPVGEACTGSSPK